MKITLHGGPEDGKEDEIPECPHVMVLSSRTNLAHIYNLTNLQSSNGNQIFAYAGAKPYELRELAPPDSSRD